MKSKGLTRNGKRIRNAVLLLLAAAALTIGLEALQNRIIPPVFQDAETELYHMTREQLEAAGTYLHSSGRMAYRETANPIRLAAVFLMQTALLTAVFPLGLGKAWLRAGKKTWESLKAAMQNRRDSLIRAGIFLGTGAISFLVFRLLAMNAAGKGSPMIDGLCLCAAAAAAMTATFRKTLAKKPEVFFLCFTLLIGGVLAFQLPDATTVSWDDGHHYQHALNFSELGHVRFTAQDMAAMEKDNVRNYTVGASREAFLRKQDETHAGGAVYVTSGFHGQYGEFWLATHGLGLFLGRLFRLSYWMTWSMGRFMGLAAYALTGYFAVRRLRSGKMILACVLMIPEAVFLAANYSYDPGVTCLTALGFSYFFAQWQEPDRKMSRTDAAVMLGGFFLGCLAKQIYFPVLLAPLFLPKKKFENEKARKLFRTVDLLLILALIGSFALPFVTGEGTGDLRGGEDVNAFGQVRYVLGHPLDFLGVLTRFLTGYLSPENAKNYLTFFAYMGYAPNTVLCQLLLAAAAFTDLREADSFLGRRTGLRILLEAMLLATVALVASSMYVSFTGVGAQSIGGCQPRYLIPVIFPAMMLMGSGKIRNEMNPALYNGLLLGGMAFVGFAAALSTCSSLYG